MTHPHIPPVPQPPLPTPPGADPATSYTSTPSVYPSYQAPVPDNKTFIGGTVTVTRVYSAKAAVLSVLCLLVSVPLLLVTAFNIDMARALSRPTDSSLATPNASITALAAAGQPPIAVVVMAFGAVALLLAGTFLLSSKPFLQVAGAAIAACVAAAAEIYFLTAAALVIPATSAVSVLFTAGFVTLCVSVYRSANY